MSNTQEYCHPLIQKPTQPPFDKKNPFAATITNRYALTASSSNKLTSHLELDISGANFNYKCGDSVGVYPANDPAIVEEIINALNVSPETLITLPKHDQPISLQNALLYHLSLAGPTKTFLKFLAQKTQDPQEQETLANILGNPEQTQEFLYNREFIDLLQEFPGADFGLEELIPFFKRLVPRLYSIASSPKVHPNTVHLTLAVVNYTTNNRDRVGIATTFLDSRALTQSPTIPTFLAPSKHFELPRTLEAPIIMIGPGTGIAPFRAFLQEIQSSAESPKTWLFFGEQHEATDFLYKDDLQAWLSDGTLTEISTAFSRDQDHKIYVQHRMQENASKLWEWIKEGAYIYVCGDAKHMAKDVHQTLMDIFASEGNMSPAQAKEFLTDLKKTHRYQRDVY